MTAKEKLVARVAELEAENERLDTELDKSNRATIYYADAQLNSSLELSKRIALDLKGDHWKWMADGYDHLESMGSRMVIAILASDLRQLIAEED